MTTPELPPLPEPDFMSGDCTTGETAYTSDQMHAYALAERERCAKLCEQSSYGRLATPEDWTKRVGEELAAAIRGVSKP